MGAICHIVKSAESRTDVSGFRQVGESVVNTPELSPRLHTTLIPQAMSHTEWQLLTKIHGLLCRVFTLATPRISGQVRDGASLSRYALAMAEDIVINLCYRGLDAGQGLLIGEFVPGQAYIQSPTPMPVGSELTIESDGVEIALRVARVSEQITGVERASGMFVTPIDLQGMALEWWDARVSQMPDSDSDPKPEPGPEPEPEVIAPPEPPEVVAPIDASDTVVMEAVSPVEEVASAEPKTKKRRARRKKR